MKKVRKMKEVNIKAITTEGRNINTLDIDRIDTIDILKKMNDEDKTVAYAVEKSLPQIAPLVDKIVECFKKDGRLIYVGAGTSGRIGMIDAAECHPTFSCPYEMVQCLMAGGNEAIIRAVEGAEDNREMAINQLKEINLNTNDCVIGIAASGRTPYTVAAIEYANSLGCITGCITTSINSILAKTAKYPIEAITGPEVLMGSTRLKSGTAQKLICNMISTASMIKMGRVYSNLLTDMMPTNGKLIERSKNIIVEGLGVTEEEAVALLKKYGNIKYALFAGLTGIEDVNKIQDILKRNLGNMRESLLEAQKELSNK